ncbi:MAG: RadC family protein [Pseudobacter sp.]|uniref:RadC family protein n=1 Tax=Pseudobacter sp. TaxID=2045420 RepID=UPI003F82100D
MQEKKYAIKDWPEDDRPREKLLGKTPSALSNAELLAILFNKGTRDKSAVDLAREVLNLTNNDLVELSRKSVDELMLIKGIGKAKATAIAACLELGRRRQASLPKRLSLINASREAANYLKTHLGHHSQEIFGVIYLNHANDAKCYLLHQGGITSTTVDVRVVLKKALETDTVKMILFHNHPSGNLQPSAADKSITSRISDAARLLDMEVLDHLIIAEHDYFSFADKGLL